MSRRTSIESRKNPSPKVNGIAPNEAATQASGSTRAISANVVTNPIAPATSKIPARRERAA